ncbi:hypothetical protein [Bosea sp. F3-2]
MRSFEEDGRETLIEVKTTRGALLSHAQRVGRRERAAWRLEDLPRL